MALAIKDPDAQVDYHIDWGADYAEGQSIATSSWHVTPVEPGGVVVESAGFDLVRAVARVSGGRAGHVYQLTNGVTLSDGQRDERSIAVRVESQ